MSLNLSPQNLSPQNISKHILSSTKLITPKLIKLQNLSSIITYQNKTYQLQNLSNKTYQATKLIKQNLSNYKAYQTQNLFMNLKFQIMEMLQQIRKFSRENTLNSQFPGPFLGRHGFEGGVNQDTSFVLF